MSKSQNVATLGVIALCFGVGYLVHGRLERELRRLEQRVYLAEADGLLVQDQYRRDSERQREVMEALAGRLAEHAELLPQRDGRYDFDNSLVDFEVDSLERLARSLYTVRTRASGGTVRGRFELSGKEGCAVALLGRYLFTVNHVVDYRSQENIPADVRAGIAEQDTFLVDDQGNEVLLEKVVADAGRDVAVFAVPEGASIRSLPYRLGRTEDLRVGNVVYVVGSPGLRGVNVREGMVSRTAPYPGIDHLRNTLPVSAPINPGDSGSLVVALRDGQYEVVGFPRGKYVREEGTGFMVDVSSFMRTVRDALNRDQAVVDRHRPLFERLVDLYGEPSKKFY